MSGKRHTTDTIEHARLSFRQGMSWTMIAEECGGVARSTIERWCEGLERDMVDPLLLPLDCLWQRTADVFEFVTRYVPHEEVRARLEGTPELAYWDKSRARRQWMRLDRLDEMFCRLGLYINMLPGEPVFGGYFRKEPA